MDEFDKYSAVLVGQVTVLDDDLWAKYVEGVKRSIEGFDAMTFFRGNHNAQYSGSKSADKIVIIAFKNMSEAQNWFNSEDYQSLIDLRNRSAITNISLFTN